MQKSLTTQLSTLNFFVSLQTIMVHLPEDFVRETRRIMGDERFERYLKAFEEEPPVSIRLNPRKVEGEGGRWKEENLSPGALTAITSPVVRTSRWTPCFMQAATTYRKPRRCFFGMF